jgi:hypothetical protein
MQVAAALQLASRGGDEIMRLLNKRRKKKKCIVAPPNEGGPFLAVSSTDDERRFLFWTSKKTTKIVRGADANYRMYMDKNALLETKLGILYTASKMMNSRITCPRVSPGCRVIMQELPPPQFSVIKDSEPIAEEEEAPAKPPRKRRGIVGLVKSIATASKVIQDDIRKK